MVGWRYGGSTAGAAQIVAGCLRMMRGLPLVRGPKQFSTGRLKIEDVLLSTNGGRPGTGIMEPIQKDVAAWVDASRYDLETARALLRSRRYVYVLFMCQQSIEKLLKAHVTARTGEFPPRIHALVRLGALAGLDLSQDEKTLLERLSVYYLQSRYPPEVQVLAKGVDRSTAAAHLKQTEALWKRLRQHLARKRLPGER